MGRRKTNKQAPLTKDGEEKKDEKGISLISAKKTYALPKAESKELADNIDGIEKVNIPDNLEREIVDMILQEHQKQKRFGVLSKRITTKKLMDVYNSLSGAGFSHHQIEAAMTATIMKGGDVHDALDWLCLNTANDQLPKGFSQTLQEEEEKKYRPRFDPSQQKDARMGTSSATQTVPVGKTGKVSKPDDGTVKDWILQYAEQSSGSSEDKSDEEEDPNERYKVLSSQIEEAKNEAFDAKMRADKSGHTRASKRIRELTLERDAMERHPNFKPATKLGVTKPPKKLERKDKEMEQLIHEDDIPKEKSRSMPPTVLPRDQKSKRRGHSPADAEDSGFNLFGFDKMEEGATAAKNESQEAKEIKEDVRCFEYTRQQWTGKHPKQFLIDWCRKHLPQSPPPKYEKIQLKYNRFKCKVTVDRQKEGLLQVTPDILCENAKEAEMLGCTLALYHLCKGQSVYQLLPPPYRVVWLEWKEEDDSSKQQNKQKENKLRDQFVTKLIKKLKLDENAGAKTAIPVPEREKEKNGAQSEEGDTADDVQDSWEALSDMDATKFINDSPTAGSEAPESALSNSPGFPKKRIGEKARRPSSAVLKQMLQSLHATKQHQELLKTRQELPVFQFRQEMLDKVHNASVLVIGGETGSGKSTQIPQFLLEDLIEKGDGAKCNIVITQPRRISAVSIANRVSEELGESPKERHRNLCGYQIRFESRKSPMTCLTYCTTGVVLRQLQSDQNLSSVSHLIIDEVHERSVESDFLLMIVKRILRTRTDLKVILMSATLDSRKFSAYFSNCPVLSIPGRTFPVEVLHIEDVIEMTGYVVDEDSPYTLKQSDLLDEDSAVVEVTDQKGETKQVDLFWTTENISDIDRTTLPAEKYSKRTRNAVTRLNPDKINMDLIMDLLRHLGSSEHYKGMGGAILIFLPGLAEIQELHEMLTSDRHFSNPHKFQIFALHSVLSSENQDQVFAVPQRGVRKIVIATNIAETGITIPDIVFVVDSGKAKENRYKETTQMKSLMEVFISKANAKQRRGRAGRIQKGFCFRMYTAEKYQKMADFMLPEILRVPLEELCLIIMKCNLGKPEDFLAEGLDPPQPSSISRAMSLLREVGACYADAPSLTPLGHHLASLPVNVRIGKMLIFGAILDCLEPVAVIAAAMADKTPFVVPLGRQDEATEAKKALATAASDHLTLYKAYQGWCIARSKGKAEEFKYCNQHFLKRNTLLDIENVKKDLIKLVNGIGFGTELSRLQSPALSSTTSSPAVLDISKLTSKTNELDQHTVAMVKAVLCAGLYSQVAKITPVDKAEVSAHPGMKKPCLVESAQGHSQIHPSSVNRFLMMHSVAWLTYGEKVQSTRVYLRDTTLVSAYPLLLFGGDIKVQHLQKLLLVDNWIKFTAVARIGVIFKELRMLLEQLLERKLREPSLNVSNNQLIQLITQLIKSEKPVR
ncbi:ATP-dependent RNA helicase DHX29-like isoform X2 [Pomacea canaliculata]|uniref:ATP-dependent RNA helicase DHX29-like isoform X2 n=1 Tax=Pomacea canaliculata TaxID=400727 RepID=UPI000D73434B|nr:ATP-dependent RNA helicase DHX29-like isoform X2 [Pomacea canaliculata]